MNPDPQHDGDTPPGDALREHARYGSGVPARLRNADIAFVQMTGIPRRATLTNVPPQPFTPTTSTFSTNTAALEFQQLINEITGTTPTPRAEPADTPDSPPHTPRLRRPRPRRGRIPHARPRPP